MRRLLGWTRPDLASLLGASETAVRRWEGAADARATIEGRFEDILLVLREELNRDARTVRDALHDHRREGLRALFVLLSLRYGNPFGTDPSPLDRSDPL